MLKRNSKIRTIVHTSPSKTNPQLNGGQRLREGCFIVGVLLAVLMAVALLTFSQADPSWSQTAWGGEVQNAGGLFGAWIADTLLFSFGVLAYVLPPALILLTWTTFRKRRPHETVDFMLWGTRLLGGAFLIVTSCGLADINFDDIWYFSSGGVIGDVITSLALPTLNPLGTTLALLFLWGAAFTLFTGISWLSIVESIGQSTMELLAKMLNFVRGNKEQVIEPTRLDDQNLVYADTTLDSDVKSDADSDDPLLRDFSVSNAALDSASKEEEEYKIYVPNDVQTQQNVAFDRTNNLNAPIQQLEQDAQLANDYVASDEPAVHQAQIETAPAHIEPQPAPVASSTSEPAAVDPLFDAPNITEPLVAATTVASAPVAPVVPAPIVTHDSISIPAESQSDEKEFTFDIEDEVKPEPVISMDLVDDESVSKSTQSVTMPQPEIEPMLVEPAAEVEQPVQVAVEPQPQPEAQQPIPEAGIIVADAPQAMPEQAMPQQVAPQPTAEPIAEQGTEEAEEEGVASEAVPAQPNSDAAAFAAEVAKVQARNQASQNPFLIRQDADLPKPTSPMPTLELLYHPEKRENNIDREALQNIARLVESKLADYKIKATVVGIFPGPVITRFELDLAPGVKVSRISGLSMDLARSLSALAVRVVEVIPGKPYVGLELPNMSRETVYLSDVISSPTFTENPSPTAVVLGQDIAGDAVVGDLSKMPHVLVAGTTGSGKSVGVNVMILSMLYKSTPDDVRFIMIDPKMLELSIYEGIPHLLSEVVTDMKDASNALRWCVGEMERRYKLMSALGVRNLKGFNDKLKMAADAGYPIPDPLWQPGDSMDQEAPLLEKLPYIVVVVDEFADLIMVVGKKVEELIARIAQKARAAGIHLILATQRPSVDVITGLIKANIPTRVAFTVSTKTDSRTILDQSGAESLLGMGDMLYLPPGSSHTTRVHGAFASDDDVHAVVNDWKARGKPQYIEAITKADQSADTLLPGEKPDGDQDIDPLFDQVVEHVTETRRGSVSGVQRRFKIGYNRAARIVEQLEAQGIVSAPGHNGNREVIAPPPIKDM
ncbi:DNA translocase FtsK [Vibrio gallicus]|uniref:DNA translocase FtsK n=1 Tax=Vibrio gallicus TaxID=190897 RepID=UPI0021C2E581|nr:DNA translocase FtsK 4TM domain-containing protein [Vibrio gallicus]